MSSGAHIVRFKILSIQSPMLIEGNQYTVKYTRGGTSNTTPQGTAKFPQVDFSHSQEDTAVVHFKSGGDGPNGYQKKYIEFEVYHIPKPGSKKSLGVAKVDIAGCLRQGSQSCLLPRFRDDFRMGGLGATIEIAIMIYPENAPPPSAPTRHPNDLYGSGPSTPPPQAGSAAIAAPQERGRTTTNATFVPAEDQRATAMQRLMELEEQLTREKQSNPASMDSSRIEKEIAAIDAKIAQKRSAIEARMSMHQEAERLAQSIVRVQVYALPALHFETLFVKAADRIAVDVDPSTSGGASGIPPHLQAEINKVEAELQKIETVTRPQMAQKQERLDHEQQRRDVTEDVIALMNAVEEIDRKVASLELQRETLRNQGKQCAEANTGTADQAVIQQYQARRAAQSQQMQTNKSNNSSLSPQLEVESPLFMDAVLATVSGKRSSAASSDIGGAGLAQKRKNLDDIFGQMDPGSATATATATEAPPVQQRGMSALFDDPQPQPSAAVHRPPALHQPPPTQFSIASPQQQQHQQQGTGMSTPPPQQGENLFERKSSQAQPHFVDSTTPTAKPMATGTIDVNAVFDAADVKTRPGGNSDVFAPERTSTSPQTQSFGSAPQTFGGGGRDVSPPMNQSFGSGPSPLQSASPQGQQAFAKRPSTSPQGTFGGGSATNNAQPAKQPWNKDAHNDPFSGLAAETKKMDFSSAAAKPTARPKWEDEMVKAAQEARTAIDEGHQSAMEKQRKQEEDERKKKETMNSINDAFNEANGAAVPFSSVSSSPTPHQGGAKNNNPNPFELRRTETAGEKATPKPAPETNRNVANLNSVSDKVQHYDTMGQQQQQQPSRTTAPVAKPVSNSMDDLFGPSAPPSQPSPAVATSQPSTATATGQQSLDLFGGQTEQAQTTQPNTKPREAADIDLFA